MLFSRIRKTIQKDFPRGVKQLWRDFLTYQNINSASKTLNNAWRGTIPRRQIEHQRLFRKDLQRVFPTIFLWAALPGIGNLYAILAVFCFPRYTLSRQFLDLDTRQKFLHLDYMAKERGFRKMIQHLSLEVTSLEALSSDGDGPKVLEKTHELLKRKLIGMSLNTMPRMQLVAIASAMTSIPFPLLMPRIVLQNQIIKTATNIDSDNLLLFHDESDSLQLNDEEVIAACEFRGLPTSTNDTINLDLMRLVRLHLRYNKLVSCDYLIF